MGDWFMMNNDLGARSSLRPLGLFIFVLAIMGLVGCSSLRKDAAALLDRQEYGNALEIYEKILATEPTDAEALSGRTKSRVGLIQKELIEVRFLRMSGQQNRANETLKDILDRVKEWGIYPEGPVASTQFEEMTFAARAIEGEVEDALKDQKAFKAASILRKWALLFPAERADVLVRLKEKTQVLGLERCQSWISSYKDQPFFMRFVLRACGLWRQHEDEPPKAPELFAWVEPRFRWAEFPSDPAFETLLKESLQAAFRESPWFEVSSDAVAFAQVEPKYSFSTQRSEVQLVHGYVVPVPYDSLELVEITEWVPDDQTETVRDGLGNVRTEVLRKTRMVSRKEMRTVTRMRDEVQSIPYKATQIEVDGHLAFDLRLQSSVFDEIRKTYSAREEKRLVQHSNSSPEVRLSPSNPQVPVSFQVYSELTQRLSQEFRQELASLWRRQYCRAPKGGAWVKAAEIVHRCLYGAGLEVPDFAEQWLSRELGVSAADLRQLTRSH